jgi:MIP family channel proteins
MATPQPASRSDDRAAIFRSAAAEFIGTALYVFFGVGSVCTAVLTGAIPDAAPVAIVSIATAHGLAYALLTAAAAPISGGILNPAITFGLMLTHQFALVRGVAYIGAQFAGAVFGMLLLRALLADDLVLGAPGAGGHIVSHGPVPGSFSALGIEAVITFLLVWTFFATAVNRRGPNGMSPLYIGFAVLVGQLVALPLTGAAANPARTFGPELVSGRWDDAWVYYAGPLIGAALAAGGYFALYLLPDRRDATTSP